MEILPSIMLLVYLSVAADSQCVPSYQFLYSIDSAGYLISSDGFPNTDYAPDTHQCWGFYSDTTDISITFRDFDTEQSLDEVDVYTPGVTTPAISLSGTSNADSTYSVESSTIVVEFKSDGSVQSTGFQACVCTGVDACSCDFLTSAWSSWTSWTATGNSISLSLSAKIGLGVGIPLIFIVPVVIGVVIALCCKTTKSQNSYAARRAAGVPQRQTAGKTTVIYTTGTAHLGQNQVHPGPYAGQQVIFQSTHVGQPPPGQHQPTQVHSGVVMQAATHPMAAPGVNPVTSPPPPPYVGPPMPQGPPPPPADSALYKSN